MKFCGKCGESLAKNTSKFCSNCYQRIEPSMQPPPVKEAPLVEQASTTVEGGEQAFATPEVVEGEGTSSTQEIDNTYPSNETEDISKAFYTSDTGEILPVNRLSTTEESKPKKKFLVPLLIGVGIIAALAITIGLVASGVFTSPVDRFIAIQRNHVINPYIAAVKEVEEVPISTDFTITATAQPHEGDFETLAMLSILEQATLEINFDMSSDMTESIIGVTFSLLGEELFSTIITTDEEYVGFYFPTIDGNYYIISLDSLGGAGAPDIGFPIPDATSEELIAFVETYSEIILSIVHSDNLEVNRETISLFDGREELRAHVYTLTPTEEDFVQLLGALVEEFREDELIYRMFAAQHNDPWMLMFMGYANTTEAWQGLLDEMEDEIEDAAWDMANSGVTWRVATYRGQMILQELYVPNSGFFRYEGFLASGGHRTDWFTFRADDGNVLLSVKNEMTINGENAIGDLAFDFTLDPGRPYGFDLSAVISYDIDYGTTSILDLPYGSYDLEIEMNNNTFRGSLIVERGATGGSNHILSLYDITALQLSRLTLNIHTTDEPSTVQAPTVQPIDLSDMSIFELMLTLGELMAEMEELIELLQQL